MHATRIAVSLLSMGLLVGGSVRLPAQESGGAAAEKYSAAVALQNQQLYDLAAEEWSSFLKAHPRHSLAQKAEYYLGVCYFQQAEFAKAERAFAAVVERGDDFKALPSAYLNLGLAQFNRGQNSTGRSQQEAISRAVDSLRTMLRRFPDSTDAAEAAFYLAESYYAVGERAKAIDAYQSALRRFPQHPRRAELLYGLGVAAEESKQPKLAADAFRQLIDSGSENIDRAIYAEATVRWADLLLGDGDARQATTLFNRVAQDQRSTLADYALLRLAESQLVNQRYESAAQQFAQVVSKYPDSPHRAKAVLGVVKSRYFAKDYSGVVDWLGAHRTELDGEARFEAAHWLARAHLELGKPQTAASVAESALARLGDRNESIRPRLEMDLADAWFEQHGEMRRAESLYARLAERDADAEVAPEAAYMAALAAIRGERYNAAVQHAARYSRHFAERNPKLAMEVKGIEAEALLQLGEYRRSARLWKNLIQQRGGDANATDWPIRLAVCLQAEQDHAGVVKTLEGRQFAERSLANEADLMLASAQAEQGALEEATRLVERLLQRSPDVDQRSRGQLLLAGIYRKSGNADQALAALNRLMRDAGDDVPLAVRLEQADLWYEQKEYPAAIQAYERVWKLAERAGDPQIEAEALVGLGWSRLESGASDEAARAFARVTKHHPDHAMALDAMYGQAIALQRQEKFAAAIPLLRTFIDRSSDRAAKIDARYVLGMCQAGNDDAEAAVRTLTQLVKNNPDYEACDQALYEIAWALIDMGRQHEAAETFETLATVFPRSELAAESAFRFAEARYDEEDYKSALRYYQLAAKRGDGAVRESALHKLGWVHFQREAYDEAVRAFEQQVQAFPRGGRAVEGNLMLAECAFKKGEYQQALTRFVEGLNSAAGSTPENKALHEVALLHAAQAAIQSKDFEQAWRLLQLSARQYPNSDYSDQATYEAGRTLQALGRHAEAMPHFEKVADAQDGLLGAQARFMIGELQFAGKDFPAAIRTFFKVAYGYGYPAAPAEFHPWQANAMFEAARCCESTGRVEAAEKLYADLVQHFPRSDKAAAARKKLAR